MTTAHDISAAYPLTPTQELMLLHDISRPESDACFVQYSLRVHGAFAPERYFQAWQQVAQRHTALRTCFAWEGLEQPLQVVMTGADVPYTLLDWTDQDVTDDDIAACAKADCTAGFQLTRAPLLRLTVIRLDDRTHHILLGLHHLIVDGWSVELLLRQVAQEYGGASAGTEDTADFASYVDWLAGQDQQRAQDYWRGALSGSVPGAGRPGALLRPPHRQAGSLVERRSQLSGDIAAALAERARHHRVTLNTMVRAAWGLLLARYAGREEAIFAVTVAGRPPELPGVEGVIGPFLTNVPVRLRPPAGRPLGAWLADVQCQQLELGEYQWCSLAQIRQWSGAQGAPATCESLLVFQNYPGERELPRLADDCRIERHPIGGPSVRTGFPLTLTVTADSGLELRTCHDSAVISQPGIARLHEDFAALLTALAGEAETLDDLPLPPCWSVPVEQRDRRRSITTTYTAPRTPLEILVAELMAEVLEVDELGRDDNFFDAGGTSVDAMHLSWRLRTRFEIDLPVAKVFEHATVATLAELVLTERIRAAGSTADGSELNASAASPSTIGS
ncbi:condensation domain-containing protein [Streptomyces sp. NPDC051940]|uniref:condensation domain-containing protein n=1 Tax=Streptomyces sp. NPDC051940 TaxID=3155675 RepID=UPI0034335AAC